MSFSAADITALETAIKSGTLKVRYADREVTYHSLDQMMALRRTMQAEVDAATGTDHVRPRHQLASFSDD